MKKNKELIKLTIEFCLTCPCCDRKMPNLQWRKGKGCKWCQKS